MTRAMSLVREWTTVLPGNTPEKKASVIRVMSALYCSGTDHRMYEMKEVVTLPAELIGKELCWFLIFANDRLKDLNYLEGLPSREDFKARAVDLVLSDDKKNRDLYEQALGAINNIRIKTRREE